MIYGRTVAMSLIAAAMAVFCIPGPEVAAADIEFASRPPAAVTPTNPKIESNLFNLVTQERRKAAGDFVNDPYQAHLIAGPAAMCNGLIQVYIYVDDASEPVIEALELEGAEVELINENLLIVQAMIPFEALEPIASLPFVNRVSQPDYATPNFGSLTTEGDLWSRASELRQILGLTGRDQNVVVFAAGLDDGTSITTRLFREGDLPDRDVLAEYLWCFGFPNLASAASEESMFARLGDIRLIGSGLNTFPSTTQLYVPGSDGFALMEVVHDLAPAANLHFKKVDLRQVPRLCPGKISSVDMFQAREDLLLFYFQGFRPSVVIDTFTFFNEGPYDGTSGVSEDLAAFADIIKAPVVVSAGNFAQQHWSGFYTEDPNNVNGIHNFRLPSGNTPGDETLEIDIQPQARAEIYVLWHDNFAKGLDDIDLYILDVNSPNFGQPLAFSVTNQGPNFNNPPREQVCSLFNSGGITGRAILRVSIVLTRKIPSAAPSNRIDIYVKNATIVEPEYRVVSGSIPNNADVNSEWVITVGAADVNTMPNPVVQTTSGRGPTVDGRLKPDFISFDNVSVNTGHLNPFRGTSAAAAHAGGLLALAFETTPSEDFVNNQLLIKLQEAAQDMMAEGPDNDSGYGLLDVAAFVLPNFSPPGRFSGQYYETFDSNTAAGWVLGDAAASGLTPAGSGVMHGALFLEVKDLLTFGFWQITAPVLDAGSNRTTTQAGKLYQVRFRVRVDTESYEFPDFRLRVGTLNNQEFAVLLVQNGPVSSLYPTREGRDYILHYLVKDAEFANQELILVLDMLGFDPNVPAGARVYLDEVEVLELEPGLP